MWYQALRWKRRLVAEVVVMRDRFPVMELRQAPDGRLLWVGILRPVGDDPCVVAVIYPRTFPYTEPQLLILDPPLVPGAPHRYEDGAICVHRERWDPDRGTAASMVPLAAGWWVAYLNWRATGERF